MKAMKGTRDGKKPPRQSGQRRDLRLEVRVSPEEMDRWRSRADHLGVSLSTWVRWQCSGNLNGIKERYEEKP